jgi:hypothetical protein
MHSVRPGQQIELSIARPARIDGIVRMQLQASGRTVREQDDCTSVRIGHYEFRTGGIREAKRAARRKAKRAARRNRHSRVTTDAKRGSTNENDSPGGR